MATVFGSAVRPGITTAEAVARIDQWQVTCRLRAAEDRCGGPAAYRFRDVLLDAIDALYAGRPVELVRADLLARLGGAA